MYFYNEANSTTAPNYVCSKYLEEKEAEWEDVDKWTDSNDEGDGGDWMETEDREVRLRAPVSYGGLGG